ncbi:MAG: orotate phosphoribosyltransferase-like protein [Methanosarcinales archaeon]|jgi:orotate phosphoribosyltransferase|nr:orotate phosphoribosyltransferase-like protein [Methanosarcinales archaeon]
MKKNIEELTKKAIDMQANSLTTTQIANELNISRETVIWLLTQSKKEESTPVPKDSSIEWNCIGKSANRLRNISMALCDIILESIHKIGIDVDVIVGIGASGIPFAVLIADELGSEFAVFHVQDKQRSSGIHGVLSRNFASVEGKNCIIVDDVITSGSTIKGVINHLKDNHATPIAVTVLIDKIGMNTIEDIPIHSLIRIMRVD